MRALAVALAVTMLAAGTASAWRSDRYHRSAFEHDDMGRSDEPDFRTTAVFGASVENKVIDVDGDHVATPDSALGVARGRVVAPGCSDDVGREPSGFCGLWTVGEDEEGLGGVTDYATCLGETPQFCSGALFPPCVTGVVGRSDARAPGLSDYKARPLVFLDAQATFTVESPSVVVRSSLLPNGATGGSVAVSFEVNRKLDDVGIRLLAEQLGYRMPGMAMGSVDVWAWYGVWHDYNGNGVIDNSSGPCTRNEFVWFSDCGCYGLCDPYPGRCIVDRERDGSPLEMLGFIYPGNHHPRGSCEVVDPVEACGLGDAPGRAVACFLIARLVATNTCGASGGDQTDTANGSDALLGEQTAVAPDFRYLDPMRLQTSLASWTVRGSGPWLYDESLLTNTVMLTAVGCAKDASAVGYDLTTCRFADVDSYAALNPLTDSLLQQQVKPTARGTWLLVVGVLG